MDLKAFAKKKDGEDSSPAPLWVRDIVVAFGKFDWKGVLRRSTHPQAASDLNVFLEKMPQTVGQTMLIIVGVVWAVAGGLGLYTSMQMQTLTEIRADLEEGRVLQPVVPVIKDVAVSSKDVKDFVDKITDIYTGLDIRSEGANVAIKAASTAQFGQFREAIGHIQNGGSGWRVSINRFCVGRECGAQPLAASLKINKVSIEKPK